MEINHKAMKQKKDLDNEVEKMMKAYVWCAYILFEYFIGYMVCLCGAPPHTTIRNHSVFRVNVLCPN